MSVQALTWAFKQRLKPAGCKFVLVALANYASEDFYCYPSQKHLADMTGQTERAVRGHLGVLEEFGLIRREGRRLPSGVWQSDGYWLLLDQRQNLPEVKSADGKKRRNQRHNLPSAKSAANTLPVNSDTKEETKEREGGGVALVEDAAMTGATAPPTLSPTPSFQRVQAWSRTHPQKRKKGGR